jgi:hypothetical protein
MNRTKKGIDSSVNLTSLSAMRIASGENRNKYDTDSSVREVHRIIVSEIVANKETNVRIFG